MVQSGVLVFMSKTFASTFPLPQSRYFYKSCVIEEVIVRPSMIADLSVFAFS